MFWLLREKHFFSSKSWFLLLMRIRLVTYVSLSKDAYLPLEPQGDLLGCEGEVLGRGGRTPSPPYEFLCFVPRRNLLDDVSTSDITPKKKQKICITSII